MGLFLGRGAHVTSADRSRIDALESDDCAATAISWPRIDAWAWPFSPILALWLCLGSYINSIYAGPLLVAIAVPTSLRMPLMWPWRPYAVRHLDSCEKTNDLNSSRLRRLLAPHAESYPFPSFSSPPVTGQDRGRSETT